MVKIPISFKSDFSLLKSLLKINDIISYATSCNAKYVGVLDDNPYGIIDFYDKCEKNNLNCVFGMIIKIGETKLYLYIKDYTGYLNLIKINELKNENALTLNEIFKYNEGLIAVLPYECYKLYNRIKNVFEVYLGYSNQQELQNALLIHQKVVFINEITLLKKEDIPLLKLLYKIADKEYKEDNNYLLNMSEYDAKTIEEFQNHINLKFDFNKRYIPIYASTKEESNKILTSLAINGLKKRCNNSINKTYADRLKYELNVIESMGFTDYFLIVYDYVKYARKHDIIANPRGSAAGSLVSYAIGITEVDPVKYDLLFERFLNPERVTMPDIDIDFEDTKRGEVIEYVKNKYGTKKVALIVTYNTLGAKQVIRDVGKILDVDNEIIDKLAKKLIDKKNLKENLKNEDLITFIKENNLQNLYKISMRLEGLKKNTSIHAAGVVISSEPISNIIPTYITNDGILTGFTMEYLERLGLLKMDFLGLRNLTIMHNILRLIRKKNPSFSLANIPLNDAKTFEIFQKADTDNIFQFESNGMKNFLKNLAPSRFDDLIAANALFRPGPMQNIDEYVARRHGKKQITYLHKDLEPILKSTYGIIIYQEQIMQILSLMAGYSFAEADLIRRAMSKKKHDVMEKEKIKFIDGSITRGYSEETARKVYDLIVKFADYGFNKSHSVAYAQIGYQMAYMKANYKDLFQVNTLNMNSNSAKTISDIISDAKMNNMIIVKPDINRSKYEYVIEENKLILPLTIIKEISTNMNKVVVDNAPYNDFFDFFKKVYNKGLTRKNIETLIKAGALGSLGQKRNTLFANIDPAITYLELVSTLDENLVMKPELIETNIEDEKIDELEIYGFYLTEHPANVFDDSVQKIKASNSYKNNYMTLGVLIDKIRVINTKKGEKMAFLDLSDDTGKISAVIFPKNNLLIDKFEEGKVYKLYGKMTERDKELQFVIEKILDEKKKGSI